MQDSDRQKTSPGQHNDGASREGGGPQQQHRPENRQDTDFHYQAQPARRDAEATDRQRADRSSSDSLMERGRIVKQDAEALTKSMRESIDLFQRYVSEQVEQRPYTTVGIAAGLGYLLGGGLANRITGTALGTVYRIGLALAAREISSRISIPGVGDESSNRERSTR